MKKYIGLLSILPLLTCDASNFTKQHKNGWFWFDQQVIANPQNSQKENNIIKSVQRVQKLKQEIEHLRLVMIDQPTIENIKNYREQEAIMWAKALKLNENWNLVSFLHPHLNDKLKNPVNVHAVKLKREIAEQDAVTIIKKLASEYDIVIFRANNCVYCEEFAPVLNSFGQKYGFTIEAVSLDKSISSFFRTKNIPGLAERLGISGTPTVLLVKKRDKQILGTITWLFVRIRVRKICSLSSQIFRAEK